MGYPMTYRRVISRNGLEGGYDDPITNALAKNLIAGDLRRLEEDSRDILHLTMYARVAGITERQAKAVLDAFFDGPPRGTMDLQEYQWLREQIEEARR